MLDQQRHIGQTAFHRFEGCGGLFLPVLQLCDFLLQIRVPGNPVLIEKYHCPGCAFEVFNLCPVLIACRLLRLNTVFNIYEQRNAGALRLRGFQNDLAIDALG